MNKSILLYTLVFVFVTIFLFKGLFYDPKKIQSPLIGKNFPNFTLYDLYSDDLLDNSDFLKTKTIVNVWASWCITCRVEHPYLMYLKSQGIPILGLNYKDEKEDAINWLNKFGNPYTDNIHDYKGSLALDLGVTGAPETFLIINGQVVAHYQGEVNEIVWNEVFLPIIDEKEIF